MLIDTDVIIWYMKGNANAKKTIGNYRRFNISVVTYMELIQGMRNKNELSALRKALKAWNANVLSINEDISNRAMFYVEQFYLSHSIQLADALIAATAVSHGTTVLTGNNKHYKVFKDLQLKKFKP
ncbi:MAG: type II toxin-antitoxin system VapC family toxin [Proteobacteria bacterium]|nr:type II toxin-antitoxin system VapC family toxin [Pseudomonadota bacterium]